MGSKNSENLFGWEQANQDERSWFAEEEETQNENFSGLETEKQGENSSGSEKKQIQYSFYSPVARCSREPYMLDPDDWDSIQGLISAVYEFEHQQTNFLFENQWNNQEYYEKTYANTRETVDWLIELQWKVRQKEENEENKEQVPLSELAEKNDNCKLKKQSEIKSGKISDSPKCELKSKE